MKRTPATVRDLWRDAEGRCLFPPSEGDIVAGLAERLSSCTECGAAPLYLLDGILVELREPPTWLRIFKTISATRHVCASATEEEARPTSR